MSQGDGDTQGPWNSGEKWEAVSEREQQAAVDGGDGTAMAKLSREDEQTLAAAAARTASNPDRDPMTGAEIGGGPGTGLEENGGDGPSSSRPPRRT
jgi:Mn-containing catalase